MHPITGNAENPLNTKRGLLIRLKDIYEEFKQRGEKHCAKDFSHFQGHGFTTNLKMDPLSGHLFNLDGEKWRNFSHFQGHGFTTNLKMDPLSGHLFNLDGEKWRNMRVKLTPTFTSGKMKNMFKTLLDCGGPMIDHLKTQNGKDLDIKEIVACYTTDVIGSYVIGSCAFGLECNSFKDPDAEFRKYGRKIFAPTLKNVFLLILALVCPDKILANLPIKRLPLDIETFFISAIKNILDYRTLKGIKRNDFIQLFLEIQEKAKADGSKLLTLEEISAQAFVFFLGGFETSSTTMTFCLRELAFNQDIQDKLREEVSEAYRKNNGELNYDTLMGMKYMDKVVNETLRMYPPAPVLNRVCTADYNIPNTDVILSAGTKVFISVLGIHRDAEYYPEPNKFNPENFSEENIAKRPQFTYLPFGEGPRMCIGLRFGLMQAKTGLSMLLNNYRFLPVADEKYNFNFNPKSFVLSKDGDIKLKVEKLNS
ncbi:Cytochrome P450 [Popillia japonica]|uniref:Cytochrome P450 n=1 Tax=Popillia japonica TaxID=7064 RepID=A0AAW1JZU5_POPJA